MDDTAQKRNASLSGGLYEIALPFNIAKTAWSLPHLLLMCICQQQKPYSNANRHRTLLCRVRPPSDSLLHIEVPEGCLVLDSARVSFVALPVEPQVAAGVNNANAVYGFGYLKRHGTCHCHCHWLCLCLCLCLCSKSSHHLESTIGGCPFGPFISGGTAAD